MGDLANSYLRQIAEELAQRWEKDHDREALIQFLLLPEYDD